ncbi:MAG: M24 family metallopeptidase [Oscillospiraceae bacterium]
MSAVTTLAEWLPDERHAALITSPLSLRYLCGFPIDNGVLFVTKEESFLFLRGNVLKSLPPMLLEKLLERFPKKTTDFTVKELKTEKQLLDLMIKYGAKYLYIESDRMPVADFNMYKEQLHYAEFDTTDALPNELLRLRSVKTETELDAIEAAQKICDKAYERLLSNIRGGMTERQIAALLEFYLTDYGSSGAPFPTSVLSGENTAKQYLKPSDRTIREGDFVILEFGATFGGYCAKMCRTIAVGEIPLNRDNAYNAVSCAIADGLRSLRAGIGGKVADSVARSTLAAWDADKYCSSDFAHGIGLEVVEPPLVSQNSSALLRANTVLAVHSAIIVGGKFGVKIGDMAILTEDGCIDCTKATKSLVHL